MCFIAAAEGLTICRHMRMKAAKGFCTVVEGLCSC